MEIIALDSQKRIRTKKGHAKAVGAVARHLVEASFWVLTKNEDYKEPEVIVFIDGGLNAMYVISPRGSRNECDRLPKENHAALTAKR